MALNTEPNPEVTPLFSHEELIADFVSLHEQLGRVSILRSDIERQYHDVIASRIIVAEKLRLQGVDVSELVASLNSEAANLQIA